MAAYGKCLARAGPFKYVTSTAIKKPRAQRTYFHLVYGTHHREGIFEFRRVEKASAEEQDLVRSSARIRGIEEETGQADMFSSNLDDKKFLFEEIRESNLKRAENLVIELLEAEQESDFFDLAALVQCVPMVWKNDIQEIFLKLKAQNRIQIEGMTDQQKIPQKGHVIKLF